MNDLSEAGKVGNRAGTELRFQWDEMYIEIQQGNQNGS